MQQEPIHALQRDARLLRGLVQVADAGGDRKAVDLLAVHLKPASLTLPFGKGIVVGGHFDVQELRVELRAQHGGQALALAGILQQHRARAVAEQDAGRAIGPVAQGGGLFRRDDEHAARFARADGAVGGVERLEEAGARAVDVERLAGIAQRARDKAARRGGDMVADDVGADHKIDALRVGVRLLQRALCGQRAEFINGFILQNAAAGDAGMGDDPFVAGIEYFAQIVVGDDLIRQGAAASDDFHSLRPFFF